MKNRAHTLALRLLTAASCAICVGANAAAMQDAVSQVPTPVEQALIEHQCGATRATSPADTGAYETCLTSQLLAIRTDFGRDLSKLTPVERRSLDSVCNKVRNFEGRDAYVACLSGQLTALRARRSHGNPAAADAVPAAAAPPTELTPSAAPTPPPAASGLWLSGGAGLAVLAVLGVLLVAGGAAFFMLRGRRPASKCRTCQATVPGGGDLCQACRHEAAEALRRAAVERAEQERLEQQQIRRQREQEEAWRIDQAQQEELARHRLAERARREEEARVEEERRRREAEAHERSQFGVEDTFDPFAVLGLSAEASRDSIEAAYAQAKSKYDADQVAHLSAEVQEHFKLKAQAVERAYQMLTAAV